MCTYTHTHNHTNKSRKNDNKDFVPGTVVSTYSSKYMETEAEESEFRVAQLQTEHSEIQEYF